MLKDLVQYLYGIGEDSKKIVTAPVPGSKTKYLMRGADDSIKTIDVDPEPRDHSALDLSAIIEFANLHGEAASVWYSRNGVVCLIDDETRRDKVSLKIGISTQMLHLVAPAFAGAVKQQDLILRLRTTFADCLGPNPLIVNYFRKLKFVNNMAGESEIQQGKRTVGKQIIEEVTGVESIPEQIVVDVPVFQNAVHLSSRVRLVLDVDTQNQTFRMVPIAADVEAAFVRGETAIREFLAEHVTGAKVYYGSP